MTTDPPTVDVFNLVVGKRERGNEEPAAFPYFFLVPDEFVERTQVVYQLFKIQDIGTPIKPTRVDSEEELLTALNGFLRHFHNIVKEQGSLELFPIIYAAIFERSGLKLPLFYQKFAEIFKIEILYKLNRDTFRLWLNEIHRFCQAAMVKTATNQTPDALNFAILQRSMTYCDLLSQTILALYEGAEFTNWRREPQVDEYAGMTDQELVNAIWSKTNELELALKEYKDDYRFPPVETPMESFFENKAVLQVWTNLRLKSECTDFFHHWMYYLQQPEQWATSDTYYEENEFLTIPTFAIEYSWIFLDEIEQGVDSSLKYKDFDKLYNPMLVHPMVVKLFEECQNLKGFKESGVLLYLLKRMDKLQLHVAKPKFGERDNRGRINFPFRTMEPFEKFGSKFDVQNRCFRKSSNCPASTDEEPKWNGNRNEEEMHYLKTRGDISVILLYILAKMEPFFPSYPDAKIITDTNSATECNQDDIFLFQKSLDYLELHEITIIMNYLEKNIYLVLGKRTQEAIENGRDSSEQVELYRKALGTVNNLILKRKKEEMECTVMFLDNLDAGRYKTHRTTAIYYAFLYFIRKQLILENNHVYIRKYIERFTQYLDIHSNIAKILSYTSSFSRNMFVVRLEKLLSQMPLDMKEQTSDIFRLSLPEYFIKWTAKKSFVGHFDISKVHKLNKQMDRGGQADVYLCRTDKFFYPVVFKSFIRTSARREVYSELDSLMLLQAHPHIVRLFGYVVEKGIPMGILMEYCEGGSLNNVINEENYRFEEDKTVHWMAQAASGLVFLHSNDIIHTDLKSANMLLSSDRRLLKLADMGYCKDVSLCHDRKAKFTHLKGTKGYYAPEIEKGDSYKASADMFSFGRTLWTLIFKELEPTALKFAATVHCPLKITGSPMFSLEEFKELTVYIKEKDTIWEEYNRIKEGLPLVSEKMISLLTRLTTADPDLRPTSDKIYQEFTDYYEELLKTMDADRKAKLEFYPETKK